jgi:tRNA pseudouridine55 synthase
MSGSLAGVLVVDKPAGPTSHDVVARVRRGLRVRRAGHTGTLDPFATGVLPVCLGKATRLARFLAAGDKSYRASVRLGFATDTDDATGKPLGPVRLVQVEPDAVAAACRRLSGEILQVPPAFSARHVEGKRLYQWARRGIAVERASSPVTVHRLTLLGLRGDHVDLELSCSAGTYVRALARDLGEALQCGGHLAALRRTRSAGLGLEDAVAWDEIGEACLVRVRPLERLLTELPAVLLNDLGREAARHGRRLLARHLAGGMPDPAPARLRLFDPEGRLVALAVPQIAEGGAPALQPDVVLLD